MAIKFNLHNVTNGTIKARCWYHVYTRTDGSKCVEVSSKDYNRALGQIFPAEYSNNTDTMTDYFDKGRVVFFEDHPLYAAAKARAEAVQAMWDAKAAEREAKRAARMGR